MSLNFQCKWCHFSGHFSLQGNPHKLLFSKKKIATGIILHKFVLQIYYVWFLERFSFSLCFDENSWRIVYCFSCWLILKWIVLKKYVFIIQINVLSNRRTANCKLWISGSIRSKKTLVCMYYINMKWASENMFLPKTNSKSPQILHQIRLFKKKTITNQQTSLSSPIANILFKNLFRCWKGLLQYALNRYCIGLSRFFRLEYMWIIHFI